MAWHRNVSESASPLEMPVDGWVFKPQPLAAIDGSEVVACARLETQEFACRGGRSLTIDVDKFSWDVGDKLFTRLANHGNREWQPSKTADAENGTDATCIVDRVHTLLLGLNIEEIDARIRKLNDQRRDVLGFLARDATMMWLISPRQAKKSHALTNNLQHDRGATPD